MATSNSIPHSQRPYSPSNKEIKSTRGSPGIDYVVTGDIAKKLDEILFCCNASLFYSRYFMSLDSMLPSFTMSHAATGSAECKGHPMNSSRPPHKLRRS